MELKNDTDGCAGFLRILSNWRRLWCRVWKGKRKRGSLPRYLEQKKKAFPRFYFVANQALLDILSNGAKPLKAPGSAVPVIEVPISLGAYEARFGQSSAQGSVN